MLGLRINALEDQATEARDELEGAEKDNAIIPILVKDAMNDITKYRYTRDDKYLGRAMRKLAAALE